MRKLFFFEHYKQFIDALRYSPEDNIVAKFAFEEWSKIASDVDTEQELEELFINYPHLIQGFVLYENSSNLPIAFVYILKEKEYTSEKFDLNLWKKIIKIL